MNQLHTLKEKLSHNRQIFMPILSPEWASAAEIYKKQGVDCVLVDTEHMPVGIETLRRTLAACRTADLPCIVRVPDAVYSLISRTLDAGADGIMVPRVETLEQVRIAVESSKFPPVGKKGCGGPGIFRPGETVEDFNRSRILLLQIESPAGIDLLPDMLQNFGGQVDGAVVGPADLSISLGIPLEFDHPRLHGEIRRLISVCAKHQKPCGMYLSDMKTALYWRSEGMRILWTASDRDFAAAGAAEFVNAMRAVDQHE